MTRITIHAEQRAVTGTYAAAQRMGALLPQPLSAPAERVAPFHSDVIERFPRSMGVVRSSQAVIEPMDADEPMPLHERVIVWLGIVITAGLLVMLTVQRIVS